MPIFPIFTSRSPNLLVLLKCTLLSAVTVHSLGPFFRASCNAGSELRCRQIISAGLRSAHVKGPLPSLFPSILVLMAHVTTLCHHDYTIGWIAALPLEMAAATLMLDSQHGPLWQSKSDHNSYQLGRIGDQNVVIACLPLGVPGIAPAAAVASQMLSTFPAIRCGLLVGVGGGVPALQSDNDIRLGDVVVSQPTHTAGGVVQYDYGRTLSEGHFVRTGVLTPPPTAVLTALARLKAQHFLSPNSLMDLLDNFFTRHPELDAELRRPDEPDLLYEPDYEHVPHDSGGSGGSGDGGGKNTCRRCDPARLIQRPARQRATRPRVHYGVIASASRVMRDGVTRDRISSECGALCFEMEAAGLMREFPCVVVRGICDNANSHNGPGLCGRRQHAPAARHCRWLNRVQQAVDKPGT